MQSCSRQRLRADENKSCTVYLGLCKFYKFSQYIAGLNCAFAEVLHGSRKVLSGGSKGGMKVGGVKGISPNILEST